MTTKTVETKSTKLVYVATDGTEFEEMDQCQRYERSALGVLSGRVKELAINKTTEEDLFGCGYNENEALVVVPKSLEHISLIRQLLLVYGNGENYVESLKDNQVGKPVIIEVNETGDWAWFNTLESIVEKATGGKFTICEAKEL